MDKQNAGLYQTIDRVREIAPEPEEQTTPHVPPAEPPSRALDLVKRAQEQKPKEPEAKKPVNPTIY